MEVARVRAGGVRERPNGRAEQEGPAEALAQDLAGGPLQRQRAEGQQPLPEEGRRAQRVQQPAAGEGEHRVAAAVRKELIDVFMVR